MTTLLTVLGRRAVQTLLPMDRAIELMDMAMRATSCGLTIQPPRWTMELPTGDGNLLGLMPSFLAQPSAIATKITAVYPGNHALGLQSHQGVVVLFETSQGRPVAILHGAEITAMRTAAASALATRELARIDASHLAVQSSPPSRCDPDGRCASSSTRIWCCGHGQRVVDMADLRIAKLPDRNPVKLTIAVMPELHDALQDYAKLYAETYGCRF
jgi:hypothetical protein